MHKKNKVIDKKIQNAQHAKNRRAYLERLLAKRPLEANYIGDSYASEMAVKHENCLNEQKAKMIQKGIKRCEKYLANNL